MRATAPAGDLHNLALPAALALLQVTRSFPHRFREQPQRGRRMAIGWVIQTQAGERGTPRGKQVDQPASLQMFRHIHFRNPRYAD